MFRGSGRYKALVALLGVPLLMVVLAEVPARGAAVSTVTANYGLDLGAGHPDVFGSSINNLDNTSKMDTLRQSGSRFVRRDAYLSDILPNTTVANYRANVGGVQNPANWNWSKYGWVDEYHKRGFRTMLIMSYTTNWLGYNNCTNPCFTPPSALDVYADVIKKIYLHFRGNVDLVEIWNEPDNVFLDLTGTSYPDKLTAYRDIYLTASKAIRSVDATIPIGGPVVSNPTLTNWATALFQDTRIPSNNINFLSFHSYSPSANEAVTTWKNVAAAAGRGPDFPVYVTEWNWDWQWNNNLMNTDYSDTVSFVGNRLTALYKQHANGTNFYADNDQSVWSDFWGVYANGMLPPKSRAFSVLSNDLALGDGTGKLAGISYGAPVTNAGAATNVYGERVAWVVNDSATPFDTTLNLTGLGAAAPNRVSIFEASPNAAVGSPKTSQPLKVTDGSATVNFVAPPRSVIGVRLTSYPIADGNNLAVGATATASSTYQNPTLSPQGVNDGIVGVHAVGEWGSGGELTPWVQLTWPSPRTVGRVVLYDRANTIDQVTGATLRFSDGSSVAVPALPNDGTGKAISFPPRATTWVKVQVTSGAGLNAGLSEIQVYNGTTIAREGTVTTSSQLDTTAHYAGKAVDGVVGRGTGEWVSTESAPWIRMRWVNSRLVNGVVLYDRAGTSNHANRGTLTFSDGTSVAVTGIATDGSATPVSFPPRSVSWVQFQVTGGSGTNVGLSEIQVMQAANLASSATATASSRSSADPTLAPPAATDGIINEWGAGEWASNRELNPWFQVTWPTAQAVSQVVLYDRNNLNDAVNGGTLTFSDGSSIAVADIDNTGRGKVIAFPTRNVTWIRFQAVGGTGLNGGLSEFEAFGR